ncbi:MAG: DUF393 domain-containing protein [Micropruina sp.]|nr:MAG: DUF393 domain-containing protein [Micropruina sp.]
MRLLYDPDCGFCARAADWLRARDVRAEIVPLTGAAAARKSTWGAPPARSPTWARRAR